jgi:hypothetical protein
MENPISRWLGNKKKTSPAPVEQHQSKLPVEKDLEYYGLSPKNQRQEQAIGVLEGYLGKPKALEIIMQTVNEEDGIVLLDSISLACEKLKDKPGRNARGDISQAVSALYSEYHPNKPNVVDAKSK